MGPVSGWPLAQERERVLGWPGAAARLVLRGTQRDFFQVLQRMSQGRAGPGASGEKWKCTPYKLCHADVMLCHADHADAQIWNAQIQSQSAPYMEFLVRHAQMHSGSFTCDVTTGQLHIWSSLSGHDVTIKAAG